MLDKFDYEEPNCPLCGGKEFYDPDDDAPTGHIPVDRILAKVDGCFGRDDYTEAGRLLTHWRDEAIALRDRRGELAMQSELVGFYRKRDDKEQALRAVARALTLTEQLGQQELAAGATIYLNCATAYKAFGMAERAMPLYRRAEEVYLRRLPASDERFGGLYNNMALALCDLGRYEEAEAAYRRAIAVMEGVRCGEAECAITYINLAHMYEDMGEGERIPDCLQRARALLQSEQLPHGGYYAFVLEKCAPSFGYFGDTQTYHAMMQEAKEIYARS